MNQFFNSGNKPPNLLALVILGFFLITLMPFLAPIIIFAAIFWFARQKEQGNSPNWAFKKVHTNNPFNMNQFENFKNKSRRFITGAIAAIILIAFLPAMIVVIPAGFTGVYHLFGKVQDQELSSGIHIVNPFAKVQKMDIRTQDYTMSITQNEGRKSGADSITAITKEGLTVGLDITVLFKLSEANAAEVYKSVGVNYDEVVIRPAIRSVIREVIATYEAKDIYSEKRAETTTQIQKELTTKLEPRGILIEEILLRDVTLPQNLRTSIEEKLSAEQDAQKYEFILQQEKKEAERKIIEAEAQRDAQTIINSSLNSQYLHYLYIKELENLEGTIYIPTDPNSGLPLFRNVQ